MEIKKFVKEKGLLVFVIAYILSPIDLIPEAFVPLLGFFDDAGVTGIAILKVLSDKKKDIPVGEA